MCVFALLDRAAAIGCSVKDFRSQPLFHRLLATRTRRRNQPAHRERVAPRGTNLARHLVVGAADPARANLDCGADVVERALEDDQAVFLRAFGREIERMIKNLFGQRLLAPFHHDVHELGDGAVVILGISRNFADAYLSFARHIILLLLNLLLGFLRPVFRAALAPLLHAYRIERAANDVIANARQVTHAAAANQHDRMLLQVVADARDVGIHLDPVGQPHARDLAQSRVGLLGRGRLHLRAYAALLRRAFERARLHLEAFLHARLPDQLIYRRHSFLNLITSRSFARRDFVPLDARPFLKDRSAPASQPARFFAGLPPLGRGVQTNPPRTTYALGGNIIMYGTRPAVSISAGCRSCRQLRFFHILFGRGAFDLDHHLVVRVHAGAGRDQASHDDVFLEPDQPIDFAVDGRLGQHTRRLLERRRRDEAFGGQRRLGDPEQQRLRDRGLAAARQHAAVLLVEAPLLDLVADQERRVADFLDPHAAQHLSHDHLDMLVVDTHALQPVDFLDFVDQVFRQRLLAENRQDVMRIRRAFHQRLASLDGIAPMHRDMRALGIMVISFLANFRRDFDLALALGVFPEGDLAVDFRDDRELLRLARFEQLRHARQTAGDVLGLGRLARNLRNHVAGLDRRAFGHVDIRTDRQEVAGDVVRARQLGSLAARVFDRDTRAHVEVFEFDDNVGARAGSFIDPLLHRLAFDDIAVLNRAADFGDDRRRVRIPFRDKLARLDLVAFGLAQLGAVHQWITLAFTLAHAAAFVGDLRGDNDFAMPRHHDQVAVAALDGV